MKDEVRKELRQQLERASDMKNVLFLEGHIRNPCGTKVEGRFENIRGFYLGLAKELLPRLENPYAKNYLQAVINEYKSR